MGLFAVNESDASGAANRDFRLIFAVAPVEKSCCGRVARLARQNLMKSIAVISSDGFSGQAVSNPSAIR